MVVCDQVKDVLIFGIFGLGLIQLFVDVWVGVVFVQYCFYGGYFFVVLFDGVVWYYGFLILIQMFGN